MRDIQDKFEERLKEEFVPQQYEVVNNRQYGNTGTIYIQPVESFECVLMIKYGFYDNYCTFNITPPLTTDEYRVDDHATSQVYIEAPFDQLNRLLYCINTQLLTKM